MGAHRGGAAERGGHVTADAGGAVGFDGEAEAGGADRFDGATGAGRAGQFDGEAGVGRAQRFDADTDAERNRDRGARPADTRTHILDTALGVFAASGYRAASIRDIAAKCGISHPTLLYHFPSKAALLMEVLSRRDEIDIDNEVFSELEPRAMLRHLIVSARNNATARGIVELFAQLSAEASDPTHPAHGYFAKRYADLRADLERSFAALRREGALADTVTPSHAAAHVIAVMDGLQVQWLLDAESVDMAEALTAFLRTLVRDL